MISPIKAKQLTAMAQSCFDDVVGHPPNQNFNFNSPDEILFFHSVLTQMIIGYVNNVGESYKQRSNMHNAVKRVEVTVHE